MNTFIAKVINIEPGDIISYIQVQSADEKIRIIKSTLPQWLSVGDKVECKIHEASVCVSKECPGRVSIENRLKANLKEVRHSDSLCELTFDSEMGEVVSLITQLAYDELGLEVECEATMLIRGVDISVEPYIDALDTLELHKAISRTKDAN